jgi:hypothetical protein
MGKGCWASLRRLSGYARCERPYGGQTQLAWAALSKMNEAQKVLGYWMTVNGHNIVFSEHVAYFAFADTILLFTKSDKDDDLRVLLTICLELFAQLFHGSIPFESGSRTAFSHLMDVDLFAGPAWVQAYELGEEAQRIGAVLDKTVAQRARELEPGLSAGGP